MGIWFTSDLHLGDNRLNLYGRDLFFKTYKEFESKLFFTWNHLVKPNDTVYFLGDLAFTPASCLKFKSLNGYKILLRGNYDRDDMTAKEGVTKYFPEIFDEIHDNLIIELNGIKFNLNHFPEKCIPNMFNITGHIHGLWRVQRNMINVGIDAWNYHLLDEEHLLFFHNAVLNYYDINVFAGELDCNILTKS